MESAESHDTTGRVALVSGASRGIGVRTAERLMAAGYRVATTSRSGSGPDGALNVACDIADAGQVDAAYKQIEAELGPVEVLVANAGINRDGLVLRMSSDQFDEVVGTNLGGTFNLVQRASRAMVRAKYGRIVLISSVVAMLGSAGQVNYAASKAGLIGMARSLTRELGSRGITSNVVAPGFIDTDMTAALPEDIAAGYLKQIPAGKFGDVDDVARTVEFLVGENAGYISGALIPVDGGLGMGH